MENQGKNGRIEGVIVEREFTGICSVESDVVHVDQSLASGFEHGFLSIDGFDSLYPVGQFTRHLPGTAAKVGNDPIGIQKTEQRAHVQGLPEEGLAKIGPLTTKVPEEPPAVDMSS